MISCINTISLHKVVYRVCCCSIATGKSYKNQNVLPSRTNVLPSRTNMLQSRNVLSIYNVLSQQRRILTYLLVWKLQSCKKLNSEPNLFYFTNFQKWMLLCPDIKISTNHTTKACISCSGKNSIFQDDTHEI